MADVAKLRAELETLQEQALDEIQEALNGLEASRGRLLEAVIAAHDAGVSFGRMKTKTGRNREYWRSMYTRKSAH